MTREVPQDLEAERAVLGGMLLSKDAVAEVAEVLTGPADFYRPAHEQVYAAILDLYGRGEPADAVTVAAVLAKRGDLNRIGGAPYLHELMTTVTTAASAGYHAKLVREAAILRGLTEVGTRVAQMGYEAGGADADELLDRAQAEIFALSAREATAPPSVADRIMAALDRLETEETPRLATGFHDLDALLGGGLLPGQLVVVAGRPAMGKSTLALDVARSVAVRQGREVMLFSLEMTSGELTDRQLSAESGVWLDHLRYGAMDADDWARLSKHTGRLAAAPLHIDDSPDLTVMQIRTKARRHAQRHGLSLIVVDYLQLLTYGGRSRDNRQLEVAEMSRSLKLLAKQLRVPVIAVAQLNRGPEQRTDKKPFMSDLRESGAIEQDADIVILVHREDAYEKASPRAGEADLIVAKNRGGATATITVAFQGHLSRFVDMAGE